MNRRDAEDQRTNPRYGNATPTSGFAFCLLLFAFLLQLSCSTKPTDMRSLVPADTLVYLETNDLGAAIQPIIDSKPFNEVAKYKPDISAINSQVSSGRISRCARILRTLIMNSFPSGVC